MAQYKLAHIDMKGNRGELHDLLNLTGAEVSCNTLPAGASVPFVHHHTQNEELYLILEGKGMLYIDGEEVPLKEGDCFRIDPQGERCLRAADDSAMRFICIQAKAGSLEAVSYTHLDVYKRQIWGRWWSLEIPGRYLRIPIRWRRRTTSRDASGSGLFHTSKNKLYKSNLKIETLW